MMKYIRTEKLPGRQRNRPLKDYAGEKFWRLTAVRLAERDISKYGGHKWLFKCDCGKDAIVSIKDARSGHTKSCGCLFSELLAKRNTKHNLSDCPEYKTWKDMRSRCRSPRNKEFHNYGGRGIRTCTRWDNFDGFYSDMGSCPEGGTIERLDVNGNYEPSNCVWASRTVQANNKRSTVRLTINGETRSLSEWAKHYGVEISKASYRHRAGMAVDAIFSTADHRR